MHTVILTSNLLLLPCHGSLKQTTRLSRPVSHRARPPLLSLAPAPAGSPLLLALPPHRALTAQAALDLPALVLAAPADLDQAALHQTAPALMLTALELPLLHWSWLLLLLH